jgi:hypothetical protein
VALSYRYYDRQWSTLAIAGKVQLAAQPTSAPPEHLVFGVLDPLFSSSKLGLRRAPAACWCARATVQSTLTSYTNSPAVSDLVCEWAKSRLQVPSRRHQTKRS